MDLCAIHFISALSLYINVKPPTYTMPGIYFSFYTLKTSISIKRQMTCTRAQKIKFTIVNANDMI